MNRKKSYLIAAGTALMLVTSLQSATAAQGITIGFKLGPTWANVDVSDADDTDFSKITNFGGGGFIRLGLAGLSLQPELLALTKGAQINDPGGDDEADVKIDYIEVPVLLNFSLGMPLSPYVLVGPSFGFDIGCEFEVDSNDISGSVDCDDGFEGDEDAFKRKSIDVGIAGGLGVQFPLGPGNLLVEGRYTHGLTNISDSPDDDDSVKNRWFGLFAGFSISLGRR